MHKMFIRENATIVAIILFICVFASIQMYKPLFLYNADGSIRDFGIGYKNKTILPVWLLSIVLGIVCYLIVVYYVVHPKFF